MGKTKGRGVLFLKGIFNIWHVYLYELLLTRRGQKNPRKVSVWQNQRRALVCGRQGKHDIRVSALQFKSAIGLFLGGRGGGKNQVCIKKGKILYLTTLRYSSVQKSLFFCTQYIRHKSTCEID